MSNPSSTRAVNDFIRLPENESARLAVERLRRSLPRKRCPFHPLLLHGPPGVGKSRLGNILAEGLESVTMIANEWPTDLDLESPPLIIIEDLQHLPEWAGDALGNLLDHRQARRRGTFITAHHGPGELTNLPGRLVSRIAGGLIIGIDAFSLSSRRTLLQTLAERRSIPLADDVLGWLAMNTPGSGRRLVAALDRYAEQIIHAGSIPTLAEVAELFADRPTTPSLERITRAVAQAFRITPRQLCSRDQRPGVRWPRQVCMYIARHRTILPLAEIGKFFDRDHSTVRHAVQKVEETLTTDETLPSLLKQLMAEVST